MAKKDEPHLKSINPDKISRIFSLTFNKPNCSPYAIPKQPQSIFSPLKRLIIIAIVKTIYNKVIMAEFSFVHIPKSSKKPEINSIQGIIIANILMNSEGSSL